MEPNSLRILLIEDNPGDARLIQEMLKGAASTHYQVECAPALAKGLECLGKGACDLLLLDLGLPDSQGLETFRAVRERASDVAVVILTGLDDETIGVQAVQQGAQDYLVKGRVDEVLLTRSISYAVERKRTEKSIRESEARFRAIFESARDSIFIKDRSFRYIHVNPAMEKLFRLPACEILGKTDRFLFGQDAEKHLREVDSRVLAGEEIEEEHTKPVRGVPTTFHVIKVPMRDSLGQVIGLCGIARDITERKKAEQVLQASERKFRELAEMLPETVFELDREMKLTFINRAGLEKFGYTQEELKRATNLLNVFPPEDRERARLNIERISRGEEIPAREYTVIRKDGRSFPIIVRTGPIMIDNESAGIRGIIVDITERKEIEKIQSILFQISEATSLTGDLEELLATVRQILSPLLDTTNFYVALYDESTDLYSFPCHFDSDGSGPFGPRRLRKHLTDYVRRTGIPLLADSETYKELRTRGEFQVSHGLPSSWLGVPLKADQKIIGVVVVQSYQDSNPYLEKDLRLLTIASGQIAMAIERKRAQEALRESEEKYRSFIEKAGEPIFSVGADGVFSVMNISAAKYLGGNPENFIGKTMWDLFPKPFADSQMKDIRRAINSGERLAKESLTILQGKEMWFNVIIQPIRDSNGMVSTAQVIANDMTERKKIETRDRARLSLLDKLRTAKSIDQCLQFGCEAIYDAQLFKRAVLTLHNENREIINLGQVGLDHDIVEAARKAPAPDRDLADRITQEKFQISHSYFIPREAGLTLEETPRYIPQETSGPDGESAWRPGDELFVPVMGGNEKDRCDGWLSVDTPFDRNRPALDTIYSLEEIVDIVAKKAREIRSVEELARERQALQEKNIAMREVLASIEAEKTEIRQQIAGSIDHVLMPALNKLQRKNGMVNRAYYELLKHNLQELAMVSGGTLRLYSKLSPREMEICSMIKNGATSKDISEALNIALATVQKHREVIRRKIGLTNKSINLTSYLKNL